MKRSTGFLVASAFAVLICSPVFGDDKDASPILDRAIMALGGEEKLAKAAAVSWKSKGTVTINDNETPIKLSATLQGLDRENVEFEIEFNGEMVKGLTIVNGSKGWRKFGDNVMDLQDEELTGAKQGLYLQAIEMTILPIKSKGFKAEAAPEATIKGKPAEVVKGTGPDGKTFTLYFDKETHLPLRLVATVMGFGGQEALQEINYSDFKEFSGIKKATKIESKRDGNPFSKQEIVEFKVVEKPEASLFEEPK